MDHSPSQIQNEELTNSLARLIVDLGRRMELPYIAASADISDPAPMMDLNGQPFAETIFKWFDPDFEYWKDRTHALRSGFLSAARICAEPFYFDGQKLASWRRNTSLETFNQNAEYELFGIKSAVIAPCHMPSGVLGAIVWASNEARENISDIFSCFADEAFLLTIKFLTAYRDVTHCAHLPESPDLTRREVQCLRWAAIGKTDSEIATIMDLSVPTVRFHLTNASKKFGVHGRANAVRVATGLGYIGSAGH